MVKFYVTRHILLTGLLALCLDSCTTPIRTHIFPKRTVAVSPEEQGNLPPQLDNIKIAETSSDTAFVEYRPPSLRIQNDMASVDDASPVTGAVEFDMYREFAQSLDKFDGGNFTEACESFEFLSGILEEGDSLYYEALFMLAECKLTTMEIAPAVKMLYELETSPRTPASVKEKALLRIGHSFCLTNDKKGADQVFQRFRTRYPKSPFLPLANCSSLK